ncbi:regulator of chromosome condensation [Anaeramoeba flamelloides]|uniref:Regulator of chromosome condensation n=1 Tax=Anaeramoeba flamelloides TaxID=1746091 RepID=A0AAV7Z314_9EUKA|nr:regulator of chromosome condensation [Anaeramoeba flamelloides]
MGNVDTHFLGWGTNDSNQLGLKPTSKYMKDQTKPVFITSLPKNYFVRQIDAGPNHVAVVAEHNKRFSVFTWGNSSFGQLGHGNTKTILTPTPVNMLKAKKIIQVACGKAHTLALSKTGKVFAFGRGEDGELGLGDLDAYNTPQQITHLDDLGVIAISAGESHSAAVTSKGKLFTWGGGFNDILGHGKNHEAPFPRVVESLLDEFVKQVSCGSSHTLVLCKSGNVYSWGFGSDGQLGLGHFKNENVPRKIESLSQTRISYISAGFKHSAAISAVGDVFTFGHGKFGQLGHGNNKSIGEPMLIEGIDSKIFKISCGKGHTIAIARDKSVYVWGSSGNGQLGLGTKKPINVPKKVAKQKVQINQICCKSNFSFALTTNPILSKPLQGGGELPERAFFRVQKQETNEEEDEEKIKRKKKDKKSRRKRRKKLKVPLTEAMLGGEGNFNDTPPEAYLCDLTGKLMKNPVTLSGDGFTYDHDAIEEWLKSHNTSPKTNQVLTSQILIQNHNLRSQIKNSKFWKED